jgi:putative ABC transport system permease protein
LAIPIRLGKIINFDNHDFTITAVVKDLPEQSHFAMNFLAPISTYQSLNSDLLTKWYISAFSYYMVVPSTGNLQEIEKQITNLFAQGNGIF